VEKSLWTNSKNIWGFNGRTWKASAPISAVGGRNFVFLLRAAPIVPLSLISVAAGVLKIPVGLFVVWSVLGTIVRCYLLAILGWQMGGKALEVARGVNRFESLISVVIALGVVAGILYVRHRVRKGLGGTNRRNDSAGKGG
jgi:uncharacterized membrane protein YdjX (TVP38/TMEM64 family)